MFYGRVVYAFAGFHGVACMFSPVLVALYSSSSVSLVLEYTYNRTASAICFVCLRFFGPIVAFVFLSRSRFQFLQHMP